MRFALGRTGAPNRLILSFLLLLLLPATAVVWLGIQLFEQDRDLEARQLAERRESAADRFVAGLEQAVAASERRLHTSLAGLGITPEDDAMVVAIGSAGILTFPPDRLLYYPKLPPAALAERPALAAAEALEYRAGDSPAAAATFRSAAASASDDNVRAAALVGLARNQRKVGRHDEALRTYTELSQLRGARVLGVPADLVARRARCGVLRDIGRQADLKIEADALAAGMIAGRWKLDAATFTTYLQQVEAWLGAPVAIPADRHALTAAAEWTWRQRDAGDLPPAGRHSMQLGGVNVTVLWQSPDDRVVALVAGPGFQTREWFNAARAHIDARGLTAVLADAGGTAVIGALPAGVEPAALVRRRIGETGLPWVVLVGDGGTTAPDGLGARRRMLLAGLSLLLGLVVAGAYFTGRALNREFAVARLQADFVSAVSHEFRTPLTSLQQFTALLSDAEEPPAAKRRVFYEAQARGVERLRRLVESLLDFGRMEAGARPYRFEPLDPTDLVRSVVTDFERDGNAAGFTVRCTTATGGRLVRGDREALARAVWNLLDNAVKYSGASREVEVRAGVEDHSIAIAVRDRGLGIPRQEQHEIFDKFVRGEANRARGIKGTGIGLAMVRHIVQAHGGSIGVESEPGAGSTFTIVLPILTS